VDINTLTDRIEAACTRKREQEKRLLKGYQKVMMAATFAEAGESETAKAYLEPHNKLSADSKPKGDRNGG